MLKVIFNAKVSEDDEFEEIKVLLISYNKMINEIQNKQNLIISKSKQDEKKRLFIEAILSLLITGVISLDNNFNINLVNKSALKMLQKNLNNLMNNNFLKIFPQWKSFIIEFNKSDDIFHQKQVEFIIGDNSRIFNLKIIKEINDNKIIGYLVTIDDMTSLILAEKHAAWSDIARKIAHEVKNPLTPIKLSAERIEKKSKENNIDFNELSKLTQTISKQVDDIGQLVDEFSSFARMPKAEIKMDNFTKTLKESFELFANVHSNINFILVESKELIFFQFDRFQLSHAFNNLIKNAVEAVSNIPNPSIKIEYIKKPNNIIVYIIDNGIGVDSKIIRKLFEPYYTTKDKGTGLGLSIVKKIIDDHNGTIKIAKNINLSGSTITLKFNC